MAPSHYYSHSESAAFAWISKHVPSPRGVKPQHVFSSEDDFFPGLQGRSDSSARGGRWLEQPLFKWSAPLAALQQPGLRLGWGQEESTSASVAASHTTNVHEENLGDDLPYLALADLDYQHSVWSYDRRESVNTEPFAVARAPQQAHATFDMTLPQPNTQEEPNVLVQGSNVTTATTLTSSQQPRSQSAQNSRPRTAAHHNHPSSTQDDAFTSDTALDENAASLKRAEIIAKAKAKPSNSSSGILTTKSAPQKRAALQKNRHRKPILDTSAPLLQPEKLKTKSKPISQVELRYDNTPQGHRTALTLAIQKGLVNADNDDEVATLMKTIRDTTDKKVKDSTGELDKHITAGGAALGVINQDAMDQRAGGSGTRAKNEGDTVETQDEGGGKNQSLKGKAKKNAKKMGLN